MTDENQEVEQPQVEAAPEVDYQAKVLQLEADMERVLNKNNELLGEKKKVQASNKALKEEENIRAKKNGDFEKLLESSEAERNKALDELTSYKQEAFKKSIDVKALKLTNELKAIPESAELLAHFIANELNKLTDEKGDVSETALNALKHQFMNDDKYKPLLQGNLSNGGGAAGAKGGAHNSNEKSIEDFNKMDASAKMKFSTSGGKII
tara:strand:+ start:77 stop:703 length:627 start_codon:yes stop_codon:yes gene_type:complete